MTDAAPDAAAAAAAAAVAPPAASNQPWFDTFADPTVKAFATTKNWATPEEAVRSTLNLEKLIGVPQDQVLKLPKADAPDADWAPVYDRLGRPKTPDEYKIEVPAGADDSYAKHIAKLMHDNGLTVKQAQNVAKGNAEYVANQIKVQEEKRNAENLEQKKALEQEWGQAMDKNVQIVRAAAAKLGLTKEIIDDLENVMGLKNAMQFVHQLGVALGEDKFEGGGFGGALTPAQAQAKISMLKQDQEFAARYAKGDAAARQEMDNLHIMAYPPAKVDSL